MPHPDPFARPVTTIHGDLRRHVTTARDCAARGDQPGVDAAHRAIDVLLAEWTHATKRGPARSR